MYILHLSIGVLKREKYLCKQQFKSIIVKCIKISIFFLPQMAFRPNFALI